MPRFHGDHTVRTSVEFEDHAKNRLAFARRYKRLHGQYPEAVSFEYVRGYGFTASVAIVGTCESCEDPIFEDEKYGCGEDCCVHARCAEPVRVSRKKAQKSSKRKAGRR